MGHLRQRDWYIGLSWATGIGGSTRQEESPSEVNTWGQRFIGHFGRGI